MGGHCAGGAQKFGGEGVLKSGGGKDKGNGGMGEGTPMGNGDPKTQREFSNGEGAKGKGNGGGPQNPK